MEEKLKNDLSILLRSGSLTESARERFNNIIYEKGLTQDFMAHLFGVTSTTMHKWKTGETKRLPITSRRRMREFLTGALDEQIESMLHGTAWVAENVGVYNIPRELEYYMNRFQQVYEMMNEHSSELGRIYIAKMDAAIVDTIRILLPKILNPTHYEK